MPRSHVTEAQEILLTDEIFRQLVVQRSRAYARESQIREYGKAAAFPERKDPQVAAYSIRKTYGRMLELFEKAFAKRSPLFTLPMYYPLHWYRGPDKDIDSFEENRQKQVVGLIRTNFLKRFESSVAAFELSCDRLLQKLLAFLEVHSQSDAEKKRLARWKAQKDDVLGYVFERQLELWGEENEDADDEDIVPQEMLAAVERLDRAEYDVEEMMSETFLDLDQIVEFLNEARRFEPKHDDKLQKLIRLLKSKPLAKQKILIFTEFADTARYLKRHLDEAGIDGVEQVDSATKKNRADVIHRFAPYYNGLSSPELAEQARNEIRVLISTDVLSEGLNLQDASRMMNYDIHWNPVRLMQRIGRVDRRMNPEIEKQLVADHPEAAASRGKVWFWNFLPPDELNEVLSLYTRVTQKTLLISETLGIEGKKLLTPDDDFKALKEFNHAYEGTRTAVENMHLEYQALLQADPELEARLVLLPRRDLQRPQAPCEGRARCLLLLRASRPRQGEERVYRGSRHHPLVPLRHQSRDHPRGAGRDRREYPREARDAPPLHHGGSDAPRYSQADREARQEQLPEARRCPRRRQAAAALLDGVERGLSRCRPTTANASPASAASTSSWRTYATSSAGRSTRKISRS